MYTIGRFLLKRTHFLEPFFLEKEEYAVFPLKSPYIKTSKQSFPILDQIANSRSTMQRTLRYRSSGG